MAISLSKRRTQLVTHVKKLLFWPRKRMLLVQWSWQALNMLVPKDVHLKSSFLKHRFHCGKPISMAAMDIWVHLFHLPVPCIQTIAFCIFVSNGTSISYRSSCFRLCIFALLQGVSHSESLQFWYQSGSHIAFYHSLLVKPDNILLHMTLCMDFYFYAEYHMKEKCIDVSCSLSNKTSSIFLFFYRQTSHCVITF